MTEPLRLSRSPDTWRPGSWEPGRLGLRDSIGITVLLIAVAMVRGIDYITPAPISTTALSIVEQAAPLWAWGMGFMIPAVVLAASTLTRVHLGVWVGHWLLAIAYVSLAVGLGAEYVTRPWLDGIRSATAMMLPAILHCTVAVRTGWRPPRWTPQTS